MNTPTTSTDRIQNAPGVSVETQSESASRRAGEPTMARVVAAIPAMISPQTIAAQRVRGRP